MNPTPQSQFQQAAQDAAKEVDQEHLDSFGNIGESVVAAIIRRHFAPLEAQLVEARQTCIEIDLSHRKLEQELDEARRKAKALDWLDKNKWRQDGDCDRCSTYYWRMSVPTGQDYYKLGKELPLLEAIEAAMKK